MRNAISPRFAISTLRKAMSEGGPNPPMMPTVLGRVAPEHDVVDWSMPNGVQ